MFIPPNNLPTAPWPMNTSSISTTLTINPSWHSTDPPYLRDFEMRIQLEDEVNQNRGVDLVNDLTDHKTPSDSILDKLDLNVVSLTEDTILFNGSTEIFKAAYKAISEKLDIRITIRFNDRNGDTYMFVHRKNCKFVSGNFGDCNYDSDQLKSLSIKYTYREESVQFND